MANIVNAQGTNVNGTFDVIDGGTYARILKGMTYRKNGQHTLRLRDAAGTVHEHIATETMGWDTIHTLVDETLEGLTVAAR